jgi:hypothetical protein
MALGGIWGLYQYFQSPSGFESQAVVSITRTNPIDNRVSHHADHLKGHLIVEQCLYREGGKLQKLSSFKSIAKDQMADHVIRNLIVEPVSNDGAVISLRYISSNKNDSPTLLNNLVATYQSSLSNHEKHRRRAEISRLKDLKDDGQDRVRVSIAKVKKLQDSIQTTDIAKIASLYAARIEELRSKLLDKQHLRQQVEKALAGNSKSKTDMIWMLNERDHLKSSSIPLEKDESKDSNDSSSSTSNTEAEPENDSATLLLTRFQSLINSDIERMSTELASNVDQYSLFNKEALKNSIISEEIRSAKSEFEAARAELTSLNRQISEIELLDNHQLEKDWNFEQIQVAREGTYTRRATLFFILQPLFLASLGGLVIGMLFSIILK